MTNQTIATALTAANLATGNHEHGNVSKDTYSGVYVQIKPIETATGVRFQAEITSGYRAGKLICHAMTDIPVHWLNTEDAEHWLKETGYTVDCDRGNVANDIEQSINATIQSGVLTLEDGHSIDLKKVQSALNFGFQETGDHDLMNAGDELAKITGFDLGPSGEFVQENVQNDARSRVVDASSRDVLIGAYNIKLRLDADGHLTLAVTSNDKSNVLDVGEDVAMNDAEFAVRLSTESIERSYNLSDDNSLSPGM